MMIPVVIEEVLVTVSILKVLYAFVGVLEEVLWVFSEVQVVTQKVPEVLSVSVVFIVEVLDVFLKIC